MKIRTRLLITSLLLFAAGSYWFVSWVLDDFRFHYFMTMEESMVETATVLSELAAADMAAHDPAFRQSITNAVRRDLNAQIYDFTKTNINLRVLITDADGIVQFDSANIDEGVDYTEWRDVRLTLNGEYGARATQEDDADTDSLTFYVSSPILIAGETRGVLSVGKPVSSILPFMRKAKNRLIVGGVMGVIALLLLQALISFWVTRPIRMLTAYAQDVRDGKPVPCPHLPHSDMGDLANAFEEMRDALEGRKYVEHYIQSLTHEMKSPLAAIRGASELLDEEMPDEQRRRFLQNIRSETRRMHSLIDRLLALAGLEKRKGIEHAERVDLAELTAEVIDTLMPLTQQKNLLIRCEPADGTEVTGEAFLLRQALVNLLQNAIDFSPENGAIDIKIFQGSETVDVRICDEGPGIPDFAQERIFERFYSLPRPDHGKKSSGLGLNFVREIAKLHGGSITLTNRSPHGAEARLRLPAAV